MNTTPFCYARAHLISCVGRAILYYPTATISSSHHRPSGPTVLSITLVYPASFWPKLLLLIHDGCLSSFVRMVNMQPLSQLSNCCRSRKCIQWHIPVHAIFAVFYLFFYQFYQGHLGLQTKTRRQRTHLLSARSSAITRRHLQAPW